MVVERARELSQWERARPNGQPAEPSLPHGVASRNRGSVIEMHERDLFPCERAKHIPRSVCPEEMPGVDE